MARGAGKTAVSPSEQKPLLVGGSVQILDSPSVRENYRGTVAEVTAIYDEGEIAVQVGERSIALFADEGDRWRVVTSRPPRHWLEASGPITGAPWATRPRPGSRLAREVGEMISETGEEIYLGDGGSDVWNTINAIHEALSEGVSSDSELAGYYESWDAEELPADKQRVAIRIAQLLIRLDEEGFCHYDDQYLVWYDDGEAALQALEMLMEAYDRLGIQLRI